MQTKPIPGYESQYLIDELGNVYSQARLVPTGINGGISRSVGGRILKNYYNRKKQKCVKLHKGGKCTSFMISTLLKRTFV